MKSTFKEYTVIFVDDDEKETEIVKYEGLHYLDTVYVTYTEKHPTKKSDETYKYVFAGFDNDWDNEDDSKVITSITFDKDLTAKFKATYEPVYIDYTVTFVLNNGEDDISNGYHYDQDVTIPDDPEKAPDYDAVHKVNIREYDFAYWYTIVNGQEVPTAPSEKCKGTVTYYAKYTPTTCEYDVTFTVNYPEGFEVPEGYFETDTTKYKYGASVEVPALVGEITVGGIVYELLTWDPTVDTTCHGPASYEIGYRIKPDTLYTVTFKFENKKDDDFSRQYTYGEEIVVPDDPEKGSDETYTYTFEAWDPSVVTEIRDGKEVAVCQGNAVYSALYTPHYIEYEVRFIDDEDKEYAPILVNGKEVNTYHYDGKVAQPEDPKKDKDNYNTYEFIGWVNTSVSGAAVVKTVPDCTGDVTYMAVYKPTAIIYNVVFENEGANVKSSEYGYGDEIVVPENLTKGSDDKYDYTFIGWAVKSENEAATYAAADVVIAPLKEENNPVYNVTQSITYTAVYEPTLRVFIVDFVDEDGSTLGSGYSYTVTWGESVKTDEYAAATSAANGRATMMAHENYEYFFAGWTDVNKKGVEAATEVITADTTFYASYVLKQDYMIFYHGADPSKYGVENEEKDYMFTKASVKEGSDYTVITYGPSLAETNTTKFEFIGWSTKYIAPYVFPDATQLDIREARANVVTISRLAAPTFTTQYVLNELDCVVEIKTVANKVDLYPVYNSIEKKFTVTFKDANGTVLAERSDFIYNEDATTLKPANPQGWTSVSGYTTTTYTFKGWDVSDDVLKAVQKDMVVTAQYDSKSNTVILPPIVTPTPTPSPSPTPTVTPTPVEEEIIDTPETPQGPVEEPEEEIIPPQPETPQGAPEEEVEIDDIETPQGDLPKTGTTPTAVFFGLGAACIMLGGVMLKSVRRREDEM